MLRSHSLIITTFYFFVFILLSVSEASLSQPQSAHFELQRYRSSPRDLFYSDLRRQQLIRTTVQRNYHTQCESPSAPVSPNEAFQMPIGSGAYTGTGQYFVRVRVGTPARPYLLVADTGSDLTWVKCRYGKKGGGTGGQRVFRPEKSKSWQAVKCDSEMCRKILPFALATCPRPDSPCSYDYSYSDESRAQGIFANESATITLSTGKRTKLHGLIIGCTTNSSGSSFRSSDGVLGLGYSSVSFASLASSVFGGVFSYCLVDHLSPRNLSSVLTFGPSVITSLAPLSQSRVTPLIIDSRLTPFYAVLIRSVTIDDEVLDIPAKVWDINAGGGTILDSGTSLTVLVDPAYKVVVSAIHRKFSGFKRVQMDPFEYCYNWTKVRAEDKVKIPKLALHFEGKARLEPPSKSYIIDVAEGVKCIGITSVPWPGQSTMGNILQQEHVWEFDIRNKRLVFERSKCGRS